MLLPLTIASFLSLALSAHSRSVISGAPASLKRQSIADQCPALNPKPAPASLLRVLTSDVSETGPLASCPPPVQTVTVGSGLFTLDISLSLNASCQGTPLNGYLPAVVPIHNDQPGGPPAVPNNGQYTVESAYQNLQAAIAVDRAKQIERGAANFQIYQAAKLNAVFGKSGKGASALDYDFKKGQAPVTGQWNMSIVASPANHGGYSYSFLRVDPDPAASTARQGPTITEASVLDILKPNNTAVAISLLTNQAATAIIDYANSNTGSIQPLDILVLNVALACFTNALHFQNLPGAESGSVLPEPAREDVAQALGIVSLGLVSLGDYSTPPPDGYPAAFAVGLTDPARNEQAFVTPPACARPA